MLPERYRFILLLALTLVVTFVSLGVINYTISERYARQEVLNTTLPLFRDTIYTNITQILQKPTIVSSAMAHNTFVKTWAEEGEKDPEVMIDYLKDVRKQYGFESAFFVSARSDVYYHYTGVHRALSSSNPDDTWYFEFLASKRPFSLFVNSDDVFSDELMVFIDYRIENEQGVLLGIIGVAVRIQMLTDLLVSQQETLAQRVYLVDGTGIVQAHTDTSLIKKFSIEDMPGRRSVAKAILAGNHETKSYVIEESTGDVFLSTRFLTDIGWYLVVEQDEHRVLANVRQNMERTAAVGFLATFIVLTIAMMMAHSHQKRVNELAVTDSLTGLVNRRGLIELYGKAQARVERSNGAMYALAAIDLDYFKEINDKYGHHIGDTALRALARRAVGVLRGSDVLARWGGDEFILLIEGKAHEVSHVVERVRAAIENKPLADVDGAPLFLTISCGVTCLRPGDTVDSACRRADEALYAAKGDGRGCTKLDGSVECCCP